MSHSRMDERDLSRRRSRKRGERCSDPLRRGVAGGCGGLSLEKKGRRRVCTVRGAFGVLAKVIGRGFAVESGSGKEHA